MPTDFKQNTGRTFLSLNDITGANNDDLTLNLMLSAGDKRAINNMEIMRCKSYISQANYSIFGYFIIALWSAALAYFNYLNDDWFFVVSQIIATFTFIFCVVLTLKTRTLVKGSLIHLENIRKHL